MGSNGREISKCYSSYKSQLQIFKLFLNFPPNGPHKKTFGVNIKFTIVAYGEIKKLNYLENEWS